MSSVPTHSRYVSRPHIVGAVTSFVAAMAIGTWVVADGGAAPRIALALVLFPIALGIGLARSATRHGCVRCRRPMRRATTLPVADSHWDVAREAVEAGRLDAVRELPREDGPESHVVAVERCGRCGAGLVSLSARGSTAPTAVRVLSASELAQLVADPRAER